MGAGEDTSPEISHDGTSLLYTNSNVYWTLTLLDAATQGKQEIRETRTDMYFPKFSLPETRSHFSRQWMMATSTSLQFVWTAVI